jgi:hypothetical protein
VANHFPRATAESFPHKNHDGQIALLCHCDKRAKLRRPLNAKEIRVLSTLFVV